jgi:hypothetical protein
MYGKDDIKELIENMTNEDDPEIRASLSEDILKIDPDNPIAKYVKWQEMSDEESMKRINLLYDAVNSLKPLIESPQESIDEETYSTYISMLSDISSSLYLRNEKDEAFGFAQELFDLDSECNLAGRMVYYSTLVERREYAKVVEVTDSDLFDTTVGAYCRALALFELEGDSENATKAAMKAVSMDPDMAFFVTGAWVFDEEEMEDIYDEDNYLDELMMQSVILMDLWAATEERRSFLYKLVFSFGYITGRLSDSNDILTFEEQYKCIGCFEEMSAARDAVHAMIADGRDRKDVDEEALIMFWDMLKKGYFSPGS